MGELIAYGSMVTSIFQLIGTLKQDYRNTFLLAWSRDLMQGKRIIDGLLRAEEIYRICV